MPKKRKTKIIESKEIKLNEMPGSMCAWDGCEATFDGMMPPEWRYLLLYWTPHPATDNTLLEIASGPTCDRDATLCSEHARELDGRLKDLSRWINDPVGGTA